MENKVLELVDEVERTMPNSLARDVFTKLAKLLRSGQERRASVGPAALFVEAAAESAAEFERKWPHRYHVVYMGQVPPPIVVTDEHVAMAVEVLWAAYPHGGEPSNEQSDVKRLATHYAKLEAQKVGDDG